MEATNDCGRLFPGAGGVVPAQGRGAPMGAAGSPAKRCGTTMEERLRIAVVGLGFGAEFVPIYLAHPDVAEVGICDPNPAAIAEIGDRFSIDRRFRDLREVLVAPFD